MLSQLVDLVVGIVQWVVLRLLKMSTLLFQVRAELGHLEVDAIRGELQLVFQIGAHSKSVHGLLLGLHVGLEGGTLLRSHGDLHVVRVVEKWDILLVLGGGLNLMLVILLLFTAPLIVLHVELLVEIHNYFVVKLTVSPALTLV